MDHMDIIIKWILVIVGSVMIGVWGGSWLLGVGVYLCVAGSGAWK